MHWRHGFRWVFLLLLWWKIKYETVIRYHWLTLIGWWKMQFYDVLPDIWSVICICKRHVSHNTSLIFSFLICRHRPWLAFRYERNVKKFLTVNPVQWMFEPHTFHLFCRLATIPFTKHYIAKEHWLRLVLALHSNCCACMWRLVIELETLFMLF